MCNTYFINACYSRKRGSLAPSPYPHFGELSAYHVTAAFPQGSDTSAPLVFGSMLPSNQKNEKRGQKAGVGSGTKLHNFSSKINWRQIFFSFLRHILGSNKNYLNSVHFTPVEVLIFRVETLSLPFFFFSFFSFTFKVFFPFCIFK